MEKYISLIKNDVLTNDLPSEACAFNGAYLEDLIDGYRTLTTSGRESLDIVHHTSGNIIGRDGEIEFGSNIPAREIEIEFSLVANTAEELIQKYDTLKNILRNHYGNHEMVFKDDPNYRFFGKLLMIDRPPKGKKKVVSMMTFICYDPYKYTDIKTVTGNVFNDDELLGYEAKIEQITYTLTAGGSNPRLTNTTLGLPIAVKGDYLSGDKLIFDFMQAKIYKGLENITKDLMPEISYFPDFILKDRDNLTTNISGTIEIKYRGKRL